ncbi:MAG: FHA domain-containing protein [Planctomycetota bacterium]|nr:FHA domain-containing protein [Planctomycetota bacterium]
MVDVNALLKLLAGPQAGAELVLAPGAYTLGSADDADLVLLDAAVRPRHAVLRIADSGWVVEPLDGAEVRLDGRLLSAVAPVAPYQVITLGGVHLALGPDGPWTRLPVIPQPIAAPPPETPPSSPSASEKNAPGPAAEEAARAGDGAVVPAPPPARSGRRSWPAWLLLLAVLSVAAAYYHFYRRPSALNPARAASRILSSRGFKVVSPAPQNPGQIPVGAVGVAETPGGGAILVGLVRDEDEKRAILAASGLSGEAAGEQLLTASGNVAAAAARLAASHPGLRLDLDESGFSARLSGMVDHSDEVAAAYKLVRESVDPRIAIRRSLLVWADFRREAELEAAKLGLAGARFDYDGGRISLSADPWPDGRQSEALLAMARERFSEGAERLMADALAKVPKPPEEPPEMALIGSSDFRAPEEPNGESGSDSKAEASTARFWLVKNITPDGFVDQDDQEHLNGDYLSSNIRLIKSWDDGAMLQRGKETLLVPIGSTFTDNK